MGRVVLDSSVLIALMDRNNERHTMVLSHLTSEQSTYVISTISFAEVLVLPHRQGKATDAEKSLRNFVHEMIDVSPEVAAQAAAIRASKGLKLPDAIISATAELARATLLTFDQKLAQAHKESVLLV